MEDIELRKRFTLFYYKLMGNAQSTEDEIEIILPFIESEIERVQQQVSVEPEVKPEIALSGRLEYEKLEEVMAQRSEELREYMEQFKNDKGQTIYEALDGKQFSV